MEIASAIRSALSEQIGSDRFDVWFGEQIQLRVDGQRLRVLAPNQFLLDRLRRVFSPSLHAAAARMLGSAATVEYHLRAAPAQPPANGSAVHAADHTPGKVSASEVTAGKVTAGEVSASEVTAGKVTAKLSRSNVSATSVPSPRGESSSDHARHGRRPSARRGSLENFVVSEATRVAVTSAQMVTTQPGKYSPLFVYGPSGCGKTHLLEGIRTAAAPRLRRIVMLSAEQFTSEFLEALRGSGLPSFRRRYRAVELLLLDDVQFFAGKRATLVELLHTVDSLLRAGRQLVMAADRSPAELSALGPELVARMAGGLVSSMGPPDQAARADILRQLFDTLDLKPTAEVVDLLASNLSGDARQLRGAVHRLIASSEALGRPLSRDLAETVLADLFRATCRVVRLTDIETAVCDVFGLDAKTLQSGRRNRSVSQPRMLAMWLARKHTRAAFSEIGHYFGGRSHSTVISASKKVTRWVKDGSPIQVAQGQCPVEDAIRRIEARMHTA